MKQKRLITGLCGSGKSYQERIKIKESSETFIWVNQSTQQLVDCYYSFKELGVDATIIVSTETFNKYPQYQDLLSTRISPNSERVILLTMSSYLLGNYYRDIETHGIKIAEVIIDEVEITDIVRPSLETKDVVSLWRGISNELIDLYSTTFSKRDKDRALFLKNHNIQNNFISEEIISPRFNTTILTTESLITEILKYANYYENYFCRNKKLEEEFNINYNINLFESKFVITEWLKTKEFNNLSKKYDFCIGNKLDKNESNFNLKSSKGLDLVGNNLVIFRNLIPDYITLTCGLLTNLLNFNLDETKIVKLLYQDLLLQACGRSLGYRGSKSVDVYIHSKILELLDLDKLPYNYTLTKAQHTEETITELINNKEIINLEKKQYYHEVVKINKHNLVIDLIKNNFTITGNNSDKLHSYEVKINQLKGTGVTFKKVADYFNLPVKRNNGKSFITGIKIKSY